MTREEKLRYYEESKGFGYVGSFLEYWTAHTELLKEVGKKHEDKIPLAVAKQLVSGVNIATINNQPITGGGNITINNSPAGNSMEVQVNINGDFASDSTFTLNPVTKAVNVKSLSINTNSSLNKQDDLFSIENQIEVPAGVGGAVAFTTNTDVITIPHSASLNIAGSSISIEFWMYNNSVYGSAIQKWGAYRVSFFGNLRFVLDGVGTVEVVHPTSQWVHVVCVYDGSNMRVYFNGSVAATVAATGNITTNTANVLLGAAYANAFNGTIDEVRIYSIALTPAEISTHYNSGNGNYGTAETNLVAGWHLDESSGTAIVDYSGNNNNGVLTGCNWVAGKVNVLGTMESVSILEHGNSTRDNSRGNINFARDNNTWVKLGDGEPWCKLDVAGDFKSTKIYSDSSIQVADDTAAASAANVGAIRYRTSGNNSYCEMCMQTGASTYAWIIVSQNNW